MIIVNIRHQAPPFNAFITVVNEDSAENQLATSNTHPQAAKISANNYGMSTPSTQDNKRPCTDVHPTTPTNQDLLIEIRKNYSSLDHVNSQITAVHSIHCVHRQLSWQKKPCTSQTQQWECASDMGQI